ncbi:AmpG family muropeptide MFS transporter [Holospora elegans]|uniref:AmpG family muropeptide MFS transporter n=1 Tax=Holospora elegans TaxID=431043 RepID=UPI0003AAA122|nr:AmpG family muropeptide MFS transporter [Holospora elegans]
MGFISGVPYFWVAMTLPLCIANQTGHAQYFKKLSILFLPYVFKPCFAAVLHIVASFFGSRNFLKYTVLIAQACIVWCLYQSAQCTTPLQFEKLWAFGFIIACFGAIQDIVTEGYRIDVSKNQSFSAENLFGNQTGFRIAGLFVSSGALGIAHYGSWKLSGYVIIFGISIAMMMIALDSLPYKKSLVNKFDFFLYCATLKKELKDFFFWNRVPFWLLIHLFAYKVIDAFIRWMLPLFLYTQGYSNIELMYADKGVGWVSFLFGGFFAHKILKYISLKKTLFGWSLLQTAAYSTCVLQWYVGKHMGLIFLNALIHQMLSGAGNILIWVRISDYCRSSHTMMRYSIMSSCFTLDRLCVVWCASWIYGQTEPIVFFLVGIIFSFLSAGTFLYPRPEK